VTVPPRPPASSVTDPKAEAESALLAAIVSSSDDAIASKTLEGIVTSWNHGAERLFGYSAAEIIGKSITVIIPQERLSEEKEIIARVVRGERVDHFETVRQRKDGRLVDISLTVSPVRNKEGRIIGASKVARDITERKRSEELVRELNSSLEARVRERTSELEAFSYTIAHDLRAPLRAIHRYSDIVREDYGHKLDAEGREYLVRLAQGASRMDRLIQDLLEYSRIARAEIHVHPIQLSGILRDVQINLAVDLEEKQARLIVSDPLPAVRGDRMLLLQAMTNLVSNALKFVPRETVPDVRISTEPREGNVRILVRDNGMGIAPEHHERVFQMFERLHPAEAYPGTGVGLAIVKKAVQRMNGRLGLESETGRGSCFWFELPGETMP